MIRYRKNFFKPTVMGFSILILLFIISAFTISFEINSLGELITRIYRHPLEVSNASLKANMGVVSIHRTMKDVVLSENDRELNSYINKVNIEEREVFKSLDIVRDYILGDEGKEFEKETRALFTNWKIIRDEVIGLARDNKIREAARITTGKGAKHVLKLEAKILSLTSYARNKADSFFKRAKTVKKRVLVSTFIIAIFGISISIAIVFFIVRQISHSFNLVNDARRKAALEHEFTQKAIDSQRDVFMVFDPEERRAVRWNRAFEEISGYTHGEVSEIKFPDEYLNSEELEKSREIIKKTLKNGTGAAELYLLGKKGNVLMECITSVIDDEKGGEPKKYILYVGRDITIRKAEEIERELMIKELEVAIDEIKTLKGIIPICSYCKQIRDDSGYWQQVEQYVYEHTDAQFSHGICPECEKKYFGDL